MILSLAWTKRYICQAFLHLIRDCGNFVLILCSDDSLNEFYFTGFPPPVFTIVYNFVLILCPSLHLYLYPEWNLAGVPPPDQRLWQRCNAGRLPWAGYHFVNLILFVLYFLSSAIFLSTFKWSTSIGHSMQQIWRARWCPIFRKLAIFNIAVSMPIKSQNMQWLVEGGLFLYPDLSVPILTFLAIGAKVKFILDAVNMLDITIPDICR